MNIPRGLKKYKRKERPQDVTFLNTRGKAIPVTHVPSFRGLKLISAVT